MRGFIYQTFFITPTRELETISDASPGCIPEIPGEDKYQLLKGRDVMLTRAPNMSSE